jgi:hypothetical protein
MRASNCSWLAWLVLLPTLEQQSLALRLRSYDIDSPVERKKTLSIKIEAHYGLPLHWAPSLCREVLKHALSAVLVPDWIQTIRVIYLVPDQPPYSAQFPDTQRALLHQQRRSSEVLVQFLCTSSDTTYVISLLSSLSLPHSQATASLLQLTLAHHARSLSSSCRIAIYYEWPALPLPSPTNS